ncbi:nuclear transport factor 2 family protein [Brevundimonas sp. 2R-24]|uniref:Nuclear transport factor 2 family protein n=1 Tax=Peiella sedimenti TaxID=3061083 RepID=A0ABT8SPD9_9CAUL|nr:nuclear transport factor 2 family protein [Caulobacteraceae bacterium XZ-24]
MRSLLAAAVLALAAPAWAQTPQEEAGAAIDAMHQAASRADAEAYWETFTPDARFIGTAATERWDIPAFQAYANPIFAEGRGWTYHPRDRHLTLAPGECRCVVWFDELLDHDRYGVVRGSGVAVRTERGWRVAQYVMSFPVPNEIAGEVVERIREAGQAH